MNLLRYSLPERYPPRQWMQSVTSSAVRIDYFCRRLLASRLSVD